MLGRFSLYGFLKNQRYFEPFIILFFLERGLSFTQIGLLVGFRELCINAMEVPSGALADLYGRRRCMVLSFLSYMASFLSFGLSRQYWQMFLAMFFFAFGEAFRTGTHKAMIFTWLRLMGRLDEKTRVYGYTRSWSKIGSAFSIVLATVFVLLEGDYGTVFYYSIIPYGLGLLNFMTYPRELEGQPAEGIRPGDVLFHLWETIRKAIRERPLRRLMLESMGFEGMFKAASDYLQPVILGMALALPLLEGQAETRRSAVIVGVVYLVLHLASAYASRKSHRITACCGGEERGAYLLWKIVFVLYAAMVPLLFLESHALAVLGFLGLYLIQNFWRPILISRFDAFATETQGATVLSIESQAKSVATMVVAPLLGMSVDFVRYSRLGGAFWPVGVAGAIVAGVVLVASRRRAD
ncbi:MAG: MFS transporter [Desulfatiglandales bacterium]